MSRFPKFDEKVTAETWYVNFKAFVIYAQNRARVMSSTLTDLENGTITKEKAINKLRKELSFFNQTVVGDRR